MERNAVFQENQTKNLEKASEQIVRQAINKTTNFLFI